MLAQYTSSPLYPGNPYIEALPPMMVGRELASALAFLPPYSPPDRERPAGERLQLLSQLYSIYQPLPMTIELYFQIYNTMLHSYSTYTHNRGRLCPCRICFYPFWCERRLYWWWEQFLPYRRIRAGEIDCLAARSFVVSAGH